ncbi:uncharacterized protein LOC112536252 [Ricinus communis]|uniref:Integral membrane bound transporter domain-containing protein n=1 Tax=Ricinus communis TaxID=3988 RepID=B9SP21_RICCO|nr:uncharacterized protein LOC112536252 [Ricinus communis]EEF34653.1 hypothetical protein RCOM_1248440 [Ricinus communis]|eukprot:XP_025014656.1 uncharacterized protein LOC112536252 [Ricinus communis]
MSATTAKDPTKGLWLVHLGSALRTTVACTIVGGTTLYGPAPLKHLLSYPAFSYMTTILIVSDATLGETLRGTLYALYATIQVMILSILPLWAIGPARFNSGVGAVAVAVTAFVVALPESTPLMTKRIAFGQIVIVYVGAVIHGAETGIVMHPLHVASCTALGAFASVLAMLVPFPHLAYNEVRKACRLYVENASERLNLFMDAFTAQDNRAATDSISQAKFLTKIGMRHIQRIKEVQGGMTWEKPQILFLKHNCMELGQVLQDLEIMIRGMKIAVTSCPAFPVSMINEELRQVLISMKGKIRLKLEQAKCFVPFDATTAPETIEEEVSDKLLWTLETSATTQEELPAFFFFYCLELIRGESPVSPCLEGSGRNTKEIEGEETNDVKNQANGSLRRIWNGLMMIRLGSERWNFAVKCSLSLGFAVLFGLIFNKQNGYWSGLTIAISFVTGRQATFVVANSRAQATAMGSVYGILGSFIFQRFEDLRVILLLPWIIFTSFLRHSRMYGQAGGTSAVIGALLILGRKNYSNPNEFAIARITEACIGLICFVVVEILFQPARAATLAKTQLAWSLRALQGCIEDIVHFTRRKSMSLSVPPDLRGKQKVLKSHINQMEKFIAEATLEPNFWFLPFQEASYEKFLRSLRKIQDLILFAVYDVEILSRISEKLGLKWEELEEHINIDLDHFQEKVYSSLRCLEEVLCIKSLADLENKWQKRSTDHDVESGKFQNKGLDEEAILEIVSSFIKNSKEVVGKVNASKGEQKFKNQMKICLSGLGFCISNLMGEIIEIEKEVKELIIMENPTMQINLNEILFKIKNLHTK